MSFFFYLVFYLKKKTQHLKKYVFYFCKPKSIVKFLKSMFFFRKKKNTAPPKNMFFSLNQGSAACVGIAAQFYHRIRRQRPKDDQSIVFCNALLCAHSYDKSSRLLTKLLIF